MPTGEDDVPTGTGRAAPERSGLDRIGSGRAASDRAAPERTLGGRAAPDAASALGSRPIGLLLWQSCSQTTLSVGLWGVYALTNAWFVARGVGAAALAAVSLVTPVALVLGAVSTTVGVGGASLVSRSLGAGDRARAARVAGNAFIVYWSSAALIGLSGVLFLDPLLTLLGATPETRGYAYDYALVILAGAVTATGFSGLVRAEGRMRFSTLLWVLPVLTQITLDPLLVLGLGLGVRGAALGTVGGQTVSLGMSLWFFFGQRDRPYRIALADLRPHGPTVLGLVAVGASSLLAGLGATLLVTLANHLLVGAGGATALGAFALCARIGTFVAMPQTGIAQGLQPIVGFNAGRGETARVARATTLALWATVLYGVGACLALFVLARPMAGLFTSDPVAVDQAVRALRILALVHPLAGVAPLVSARFQALGAPRAAYLISVGGTSGIRVPALLVLGGSGVVGLWVSFPVAELLVAGLALFLLRRGSVVRRPGSSLRPRARGPWPGARGAPRRGSGRGGRARSGWPGG